MALVGKQKKLDKNNNGKLDKEDFKMLGKSPVNGNAFTGAMAKTGGNYDKAKALLGDSPAAYGTGSPFQLRKSKIFKK